jgi:hypothetical protein
MHKLAPCSSHMSDAPGTNPLGLTYDSGDYPA